MHARLPKTLQKRLQHVYLSCLVRRTCTQASANNRIRNNQDRGFMRNPRSCVCSRDTSSVFVASSAPPLGRRPPPPQDGVHCPPRTPSALPSSTPRRPSTSPQRRPGGAVDAVLGSSGRRPGGGGRRSGTCNRRPEAVLPPQDAVLGGKRGRRGVKKGRPRPRLEGATTRRGTPTARSGYLDGRPWVARHKGRCPA